jgi:hypothetical protein
MISKQRWLYFGNPIDDAMRSETFLQPRSQYFLSLILSTAFGLTLLQLGLEFQQLQDRTSHF